MIYCLPILLFSFLCTSILSPKQVIQDTKHFKLHFMSIGMGSNRFEMQPVFKVNGTEFIYTSEEVWVYPNQEKIQRDTLCTGNFRVSSIDSIYNLIESITDSVVNRINMYIMSGSFEFIDISVKHKKILFKLYNASDTTANKIVAILNSYIPDGYRKLYLSRIPESR